MDSRSVVQQIKKLRDSIVQGDYLDGDTSKGYRNGVVKGLEIALRFLKEEKN